MKILITSGGTSEAIDQVRSITNHSTGRLGTEIANQFLQQACSITLITTNQAVKPAPHPLLKILVIESTADLEQVLAEQVPLHDVCIHSMAVSDYRPIRMISYDEVNEAESLLPFLDSENKIGKYSSNAEYQVLFLEKNPKLISLIKKWNPAIRLIGFKLLVSVEENRLIDIARQSLIKNQMDLVVANDLSQISQTAHPAFLIGTNTISQVQTKSEIAQQLVHFVMEEN